MTTEMMSDEMTNGETSGSAVAISVLGPLTVTVDGVRCDLGGPKPRLLLALLLARVDEAVTVESIIDRLWGEDPPSTARKTVQVHVSNLRRATAPAALLQTVPGGYLLTGAGVALDVAAFEAEVAQGAEALRRDPAGAVDILRSALSRWHGPAYADLDGEAGLSSEIHRLDELRLRALELRLDAELRLGNHAELLGELEVLTADHPFRERFRAQQMLALYRSGRQTEALRVFARTRELLVDELGLEPSAELRDLEAQILAQSSDLDVPELPAPSRGFLFTDIEGSTAAWHADPDAMGDALARHDRILTTAIEDHGGTVFKHTGDGLVAVFPSGADATAAAVDAQIGLAAETWPTAQPIRVRMGIDEGPATERAGDWFGPVLNRASRIMHTGHGGQVLVASELASRCGQPTRPLGDVVLKGIGRVEIDQVTTGHLDRQHPELRSDRSAVGLGRPGFGQAIRGYEIREELGSGESGRVYRAYQAAIGREVAIKILHTEVANSPGFVRRFEAEAQFVARLEHPHIVALHDYWREPDRAVLVMRYLRGGSLAELLARTTLNPAATLRLVEQIGSALAFAHRNGVVHRDLKPANVLLDRDGNAYLGDFGIAARHVDVAGSPRRDTTVAYVAPEELAGSMADAASDQYAFGLLVAEALTGTRPELGRPAPRVGTARGDVPAAVDEALARATDPDPAKRFDRIEDMMRALRQAFGADVLTSVVTEDGQPRRNPFRGLRAFTEVDAGDFHGRDSLVDELVRSVGARGVTAAVGPSGSGKSSVVKAGVVPAVRAGALGRRTSWLVADMFPGSFPYEELEAALLRVAVDRPDGLLADLEGDDRGLVRVSKQILPDDDSRLLLVIDQFEELFSLVTDPEVRRRFLALLTTVAHDDRSRVSVLLTMRADFFDRPLQDPEFGEVLRAGLVPVAMPSEESLALAISQPARDVGLRLEPGLISTIVRDVAGQPGGLPLLQYVMTELVDAAAGPTLTVAAYDAAGGAQGSLARRADQIYADLPPAGQRATRDLFLRLVAIGDDSEDTRRRVRRSELTSMVAETTALESAIDAYGAFRLLSFDHDPVTRGPTVEVAHEALLREWPRFRDWIDERRDDLLLERRLEAAAGEWESSGRDPDYLLTGSRLTQLQEWAGATDIRLTETERELLRVSAEQAAVRAEQDAEHRRRDERLQRRGRMLVGTAVAAALLLALAGVAVQGQRAANRTSEELVASRRAQRLAGAANAILTVDPRLATGLAIEAIRATADQDYVEVEALDALQFAMQESRMTFPADPTTPVALRPGPDGLAGVFLLPVDQLVELGQRSVARPFSESECETFFAGEACPDPSAAFDPADEPVGGLESYLALTDPEQPLRGTNVTIKGAFLSARDGGLIETVAQAVVEPLGIEVTFRANADDVFRSDGTGIPGVTITPQPASLRDQIADGRVVDLRPVLGAAGLEDRFGHDLVALAQPIDGAPDGPTYGVPWNVQDKSSVFYNRAVFAEHGYEIPTTYDDLVRLSDRMVADGVTPWCWAANDSTSNAGGFPVTDWIELLVLKGSGPEVYDEWVAGRILFDSPPVRDAFERLAQLSTTPGYVVEAGAIPVDGYYVAGSKLATPDPPCAMALMADFGVFLLGEPQLDQLDVFPFPTINPAAEDAALGAGNIAYLDVDRPEHRAVLTGLTSPEFYERRVAADQFFIPPDPTFDPGDDAPPLQRAHLEQMRRAVAAGQWRFDGSDLMPWAVGASAFYQVPMDLFVEGPSAIDSIVGRLDDVWRAATGGDATIGAIPSNPTAGLVAVMPPGEWGSPLLGTPISLSTDRTYYSVQTGAGQIGLITWDDEDLVGAVLFRRLAGWKTRAEAVVDGSAATIDPRDVDGWLAEMAPDLLVDADESVEVAGFPARHLRLRVDPSTEMSLPECPFGGSPCLRFSNVPPVASDGDVWSLVPGNVYDLWIIDVDAGDDPILLRVGDTGSDPTYAEQIGRLVDALRIG